MTVKIRASKIQPRGTFFLFTKPLQLSVHHSDDIFGDETVCFVPLNQRVMHEEDVALLLQ